MLTDLFGEIYITMPPASDNDDKGGFVDRLAKSIFASPDSPFTAFADRQRVERLQECGELQRIVDACQAAASSTKDNNTSNNLSTDVSIPSSKRAKRISRFFKWNSVDQSSAAQQQQIDTNASDVFTKAASSFTNENDSGNSNNQRSKTTNKPRTSYSKGCVIETHELWACKALAVGCGNFLSDLRQCWTQQQIEDAQRSENEGMTYHNSNRDNCRDIQINMGRCVKKNIKELDDRAAKRQ